jgi:hypothetical protein
MSKYYTILDIISGLRPEYIKTKEELESLKKYLEIFIRNVDIEFFINTELGDPYMLYRVYRTGLTNIVKKSNGKFGRIIPHNAPEKVEKVGNIYVIPDQHVLVNNDIEFSNNVDKILSSEFAQNISFDKGFGDFRLHIDSNWISFGDSNESFTGHVSDDNYSIMPSQLDLLSYEIPQSELSDYHVEKIEKNKSLKKIR